MARAAWAAGLGCAFAACVFVVAVTRQPHGGAPIAPAPVPLFDASGARCGGRCLSKTNPGGCLCDSSCACLDEAAVKAIAAAAAAGTSEPPPQRAGPPSRPAGVHRPPSRPAGVRREPRAPAPAPLSPRWRPHPPCLPARRRASDPGAPPGRIVRKSWGAEPAQAPSNGAARLVRDAAPACALPSLHGRAPARRPPRPLVPPAWCGPHARARRDSRRGRAGVAAMHGIQGALLADPRHHRCSHPSSGPQLAVNGTDSGSGGSDTSGGGGSGNTDRRLA
jgi:hypothetical protein